MTEAELEEIRARYQSADHPEVCAMVKDLLAHLDAQAAEVAECKRNLHLITYVDEPALRAKAIRADELAAEVERLKETADMASNVISEHSRTIDSLRALVGKAGGIIEEAYDSHYDARLSAADRCAWCKRAAAWQKKAEA